MADAAVADPGLEQLLDFLRRNRGFDFTGYKRTTLKRRIDKRLGELEVPDYEQYMNYLELNVEEFAMLFDSVLINVTGFFRDAPTWQYLREQVIPTLVDGDGPIRVWSAGCASGEEAYTAAIVLAEALGRQAFQERVKIYGTDVDDDALTAARAGVYTAKAVEEVPDDLRDRYFERVDSRCTFHKDFRRSVIFGRNDLVADAPISRIDLLLCRNTLMYFTAETQEAIALRLHFAMREGAYLCLGKSEMLVTSRQAFEAENLKLRIFRKTPNVSLRERLAFVSEKAQPHALATNGGGPLAGAAFEQSQVAQLVVDPAGHLTLANREARQLFGLGRRELGAAIAELDLARRPVPLDPGIEQARAQRRPVTLGKGSWSSPAGDLELEAAAAPLLSPQGELLGLRVAYLDITRFSHLQTELRESKHELERAYHELSSTVEELETTNEELQSTNEELETTNEELQSTNEELETMNEELQSTNEELETMNDELTLRTSELDRVTGSMESILTSLGLVVVVVDSGQRIRLWSGLAQELWGLRPDEAEGHHLQSLDIGLPVEELKPALKACLEGDSDGEQVEADAVNRRGKPIRCKVSCMPLIVAPGEVQGAILGMECEERPGP
jgi:two-component system, chemotaxis family, CheB/CheR fusion protein